MRIAELSVSPSHDPTTSLLNQLSTLVAQTPLSPVPFRSLLASLTTLAPFPNPAKLKLWSLSFQLWNACVDLANAERKGDDEQTAALRHVAADMLMLAGLPSGVPRPEFRVAGFYYRTGCVYHGFGGYGEACECFEKATDVLSKVEVNGITDKGERKLVFDLSVARAKTAWEVSDRKLAVNILNRAKGLLFGSAEHYRTLASQYLAFGKSELSKGEHCNTREALKLMNDALELCEKGFSTARTRDDTLEFRNLKSKSLRFISAVQLQNGEFESVLKCVKVLREGDTNDSHPSLSVLAMKAWLGLGNYAEAEKELKGMVVNNGIPEGVWVSAVEAYFKAAGTAGVETTKGVFLGLLGRCHVSPGAAVRVVHRVIGDSGAGGEGSRMRVKVVVELVSDERVVSLLGANAAGKERTAMHAVLWNCAADHFRLKDYDTSAVMFEKSMLYVPHEIENRILRAKCFRVLCLCHLGLSQLDRALEYINEAEKLEPNTATAFLKLKIYLQQNDYDRAVSQLQTMTSCLDFNSDFLSLAANEAIACRALSVAVASLASLLNFYTSGKSMPTTEVLVLRTLVTILSQEPGTDVELLKYLSRAFARASELGSDCFFGKGEIGRQERNWFAVTSWNFGIKTGKDKNYELCVGFLKLASGFDSFQLDGQAEGNSVMVCRSLILTVSAMTALEDQQKTSLSEAEVKEALELLDRAGKILNSSSVGGKLNDDQTATVEPDFFFMHTLNAYEMYGRLNDGGSRQLHLIKSFANSKACNPKYLLQIGLIASEGPRSNHEVATFALSECLSTLLSSPSTDYQNAALIFRRLITLTSINKGDTDDDAVYSIYKQAYRIMVGLKEGEYPIEEGKWLATTAWNRAALPVRLGQFDMAKKWMNVGLELSRHIIGMETYKACMEDFVNGFQKKFPLQNDENMPQLVV